MTPTLRSLRRPIFAATAVATLGIGVPAALALTDAPDRPRLEPVTATTTSAPPTTVVAASADDRIGVVGDRRAQAPAPTTPTTVDDDGPGDISGPCDEAEHADDPRCTGVATDDDDDGDRDNSGPGSGDDGDSDSDSDDRSGSNSGKG